MLPRSLVPAPSGPPASVATQVWDLLALTEWCRSPLYYLLRVDTRWKP